MKAWVCGCGEVADPNNRDGSWRFSGGTLVEHVHDGIRHAAREVEVVPAAMSREGWRPQLAMVERLLTLALDQTGYYAKIATPEGRKATAVAGGLMTIADALDAVRAMLDGSTGGAEPWQKRLAVIEAKLIEWRPTIIPGYLFLPPRDYWDGLDEIVAGLRALIEQ